MAPPDERILEGGFSTEPASRRMRGLLFWILGVLVVMAIVSALLSEAMRRATFGDSFASFHFLLEFPSIAIAFGIFMVRWHARRQALSLRDWSIACGFFAVGWLDLFHALGFPGMSDFLTPSSAEKGIHLWLAARSAAAVVLLGASWIPESQPCRRTELHLLASVGLAVPITILVVVTYAQDALPKVFEPGVGLTSTKIGAEIVIMLLMAWAAWRFWSEYRATGARWKALLVLALVISIFSEIAFTQYLSVTDAFIIQGHLLKIAAYSLIFLSVFAVAVQIPYESLTRSERSLSDTLGRLEEEHKATLRAKDRAELYLDFLSHDIANFLTPIGPSAELLQAQPESPQIVRSRATAILTQSRRATRFIQLLRRLTEAELMEPADFVRLDLARLLKGAAEVVTTQEKSKRIQIGFDLPATPAEVRAGEQLVDVLVHLLENAARFDSDTTVRIDVQVRSCIFAGGPGWQVAIADHGRGIPPERREVLLRGFELDMPREQRGLASSLPILARLVEHFGGKLEIADRIAGEPQRGTVVRMSFPSAEASEPAPPPTPARGLHRAVARVLRRTLERGAGSASPAGSEAGSASGDRREPPRGS